MPTTMKVNEAKARFLGVICLVAASHTPITILRNGKAIARIVPIDEYRSLEHDPHLVGISIDEADLFDDRSEHFEMMDEKQQVSTRVDGAGVSRSRAAMKGLFAAVLLAALAGGGYYCWTKHVQGVKAREVQQAEVRALIARCCEERIAKLKTEQEKAEAAERRRVEFVRLAKREKELAEERALIVKCREERIARLKGRTGEA